MDLYLPSDFHLLHNVAAEDWRDVSQHAGHARDIGTALETAREAERSVDPTWLAI